MNKKEVTLKNFSMLAKMKQVIENDKAISPFFFLDITKKSKLYSEIIKIVIKKSIEFINLRK